MSNKSNVSSVKQRTADFIINAIVVTAAIIATTYDLLRSTDKSAVPCASTALQHSKTSESQLSEGCEAATKSESTIIGSSSGGIMESRNSAISKRRGGNAPILPAISKLDVDVDWTVPSTSTPATSPLQIPTALLHRTRRASSSPLSSMLLSRSNSQIARSQSDQQGTVGNLEQEIIDLRDMVSHLQVANQELTENLDQARDLIESLEINHFPSCPLLNSPMADSRLTPCGHVVCRGCISIWLKEHDTCPCCTEPLRYGKLETAERAARLCGIPVSSLRRNSSSERFSVGSDRESPVERKPIAKVHSGLEMRRSRRRQVREDDFPQEFLDLYRSLDDEGS